MIGERFGVPPWELERVPANRLDYWLAVLGAEGEAYGLVEGLDPTDELYMDDDEDGA